MSEFHPVSTVAELDFLDEDDVQDGYFAGLRGDPEPGSAHSRSYWHGWRNGRVDSGRAEPDVYQNRLAAEFHACYRLQ